MRKRTLGAVHDTAVFNLPFQVKLEFCANVAGCVAVACYSVTPYEQQQMALYQRKCVMWKVLEWVSVLKHAPMLRPSTSDCFNTRSRLRRSQQKVPLSSVSKNDTEISICVQHPSIQHCLWDFRLSMCFVIFNGLCNQVTASSSHLLNEPKSALCQLLPDCSKVIIIAVFAIISQFL